MTPAYDSATRVEAGMEGATMHGYVEYLAKRLVREVARLLLLGLHDIDDVESVGDVALLGYQGHAARASGH